MQKFINLTPQFYLSSGNMTAFTLHYSGNYNTKSYLSQSICSVQLNKNNWICSGLLYHYSIGFWKWVQICSFSQLSHFNHQS